LIAPWAGLSDLVHTNWAQVPLTMTRRSRGNFFRTFLGDAQWSW
jgi:hypothetical protein